METSDIKAEQRIGRATPEYRKEGARIDAACAGQVGELARLPAGRVACVSQSGGTLQFLCKTGDDRGVRFSYMFFSGNEIDLDLNGRIVSPRVA